MIQAFSCRTAFFANAIRRATGERELETPRTAMTTLRLDQLRLVAGGPTDAPKGGWAVPPTSAATVQS